MADTFSTLNITSLVSTISVIYNNLITEKPVNQTKMGILGLSKEDRKIGHLNYYISFGFSIILNGLLIFAVMKRSTKILQSYHKVFAFTIFVDVSLSLISTVTMFQPIGAKLNEQSIFFHIVEGIIYNPPQPWTTILASITIFFGIYNITVAPISFVYRYFIICHNYELSLIQFLCLCIVAAIGPGVYAGTILISELTAHQELEVQAAKLFIDTDWLDGDGKIPNFGVMYTSRSSFNAYITPLVVIISYTIVIYCTIAISIKIGKLRQMQQNTDAKSRRSQRQLQIVLYCQALTPFLTSALSTFAIQIGKIFGLSNPWWFYYLNLLNTWAPVANPLIALIVIAPYRKFILHPCKSKVNHDSTQHSNYITQKSFAMKTTTVT